MTAGARRKSESASVADASRTVEKYAAMPYRLEITPGDRGYFVVRYPDLPGCITQVERMEDAIPAAREILMGWLEIALEDGQTVPLPEQRDEYSGKFLVRLPKSLHRALAAAAEVEGVSLNVYVTTLLAAGETWRAANRGLDECSDAIIAAMDQRLPHAAPLPVGERPPQRRSA